ncbi:MAG: shikimate dehydrogenase [Deinococcus sp.]|nr:shikimate dehydrogenase [Deinococcus sp.]
MANYRAELVGVFGYPVDENPTVIMQEAAFRAAGLNWRYLTIKVPPEALADAVTGLKAFGMRGINLTIPHKRAIIPFLDQLTPAAELIGAVNTVVNKDGKLLGENTDGKGFIMGLRQDAKLDPAGRSAVVLGAGGAARAIAVELALAGAKRIIVVNRTPERGQELVGLLNKRTKATAEYVPWQKPYSVPAGIDTLVNATSIGLFPNVNDVPKVDMVSIRKGLLVCDVIPNPPVTAFMKAAGKRGATVMSGLPMLVYQGAIGFKLWTGVEAPVAAMRQALEKEFANG